MYQLKFNHPKASVPELEFYLIKEDMVNIKIWNTKGTTLKEFAVEGHSGTNHIPIDWKEINEESIIFIQAATTRQREIIQYRY